MTSAIPYQFYLGTTPLLISSPHSGLAIPEDLAARMDDIASLRADTDWHVDQLYAPSAKKHQASFLMAHWSRYVVDLNRPSDGAELYPGADNTELCPTSTFAREALYAEDDQPLDSEIKERVKLYWQPYHDKLASELTALRETHGRAALLEAHSIRSQVPRFFEGKLPDINLGFASGESACEELRGALVDVLKSQKTFSYVVDGRFKGGYITRHFGQPDQGIDAFQIELAQINYMDEEPPFELVSERALRLQSVLDRIVARTIEVTTT